MMQHIKKVVNVHFFFVLYMAKLLFFFQVANKLMITALQ